MKRLVLFVEGDGDALAVPVIVKRLLNELNAWDCLKLDANPFKVREVNNLVKDNFSNWHRFLRAAAKRSDIGAVLLVLDGDIRKVQGTDFCAANVARQLANEATQARGGELFSVATVFACQEFESWLIAGIESLAGKRLKDGRDGVMEGVVPPNGDLEAAPRDAKKWLREHMHASYSEVKDQLLLAEMVDVNLIRERPMRSFIRLENALSTIVSAIRDNSPVVSPS